MPHVVIEEALDLAAASRGIDLTAVRNGGEILKVVDVYLNRSGRTALVDCVVIEEGGAAARARPSPDATRHHRAPRCGTSPHAPSRGVGTWIEVARTAATH